jgi:hypothetical protein
MKNLILSSALGSAVLLLSGCGGDADTTTADETAVATEAAATPAATGAVTASADWPKGTRIVQEGGVTYRIDPAGTRVAIDDNAWRIVTEDNVRYRIDPAGTRIRIDDKGVDLIPDVPGVDVDVGTNNKGHLDVDVSTNGTDASNDRENDR